MNADHAAKLLLVQAIAKYDKEEFNETELKKALQKIQGQETDEGFQNNVTLLFKGLSFKPYLSIVKLAVFPNKSFNRIIYILAFILGITTNFLGPTGKIHFVYNSIVFLLLWNIFVYGLIFLSPVFSFFSRYKARRKIVTALNSSASTDLTAKPINNLSVKIKPRNKILGWIIESLFPTIYEKIHFIEASIKKGGEFSKVANSFCQDWWLAAHLLITAKWKHLLHFSSFILSIGAIWGIYIRGLFLEYNVVWASTFVKSENIVVIIINFILWPAIQLCNLLGLDIHPINIGALMGSAGDPAAMWIHMYVLDAILIIIIPRLILAMYESRNVNRFKDSINVGIDRHSTINLFLEIIIKDEIKILSVKLIENITEAVCKCLYDEKIVPLIMRYREEGGKISSFKENIKNTCENSDDDIQKIISSELQIFQNDLVLAIEQNLSNIQLNFDEFYNKAQQVPNIIDNHSSESLTTSVDRMRNNISNLISSIVSGAIALIIGSISGGFGEHLGIAILTTLLGTTGPIGFLIGALVSLIVLAGGWYLGKNKIREKIEQIPIPGIVMRKILWTSKFNKIIEDSRIKTFESIKKQVEDKINSLMPQITDEILRHVQRLIKV